MKLSSSTWWNAGEWKIKTSLLVLIHDNGNIKKSLVLVLILSVGKDVPQLDNLYMENKMIKTKQNIWDKCLADPNRMTACETHTYTPYNYPLTGNFSSYLLPHKNPLQNWMSSKQHLYLTSKFYR